jgi:HTH-type transcriptional regulator / antitoxin HipB
MEIRRPAELGAYIMNVRRARGLSQVELAARLGVSRIWVGQIERGKASPRLDLVLRALNELEITISVSTNDDNLETASRAPSSPPPEPIDIDAIADTNLPSKSSRRRR